MNLRYEITPASNIAEVKARVRAVNVELQDEIRALVQRAVHEGQIIAEREAPVGHGRDRNEGEVRIKDAVRTSEVRYAPGGAGGGGFFEADLYVDSALAPQVEFVMEGTADDGRGLIRPARGNVFPIEKEGEGVHFREWVHGQRPNTRWWDQAREETERTLETGIHDIK